jgi:hypothetical protein
MSSVVGCVAVGWSQTSRLVHDDVHQIAAVDVLG